MTMASTITIIAQPYSIPTICTLQLVLIHMIIAKTEVNAQYKIQLFLLSNTVVTKQRRKNWRNYI